jgi:predicted permease
MSDFKQGIRSLLKSPAFSFIAVVTIAVGIAANTALFSAYDRLVLNPVTIPDPSSLVAVWAVNTELNFNAPAVSWPRYREVQRQAQSFASMGISAADNFTLTGSGDPEQLNGLRVSATFFPTLGILPRIGRNFTAEEDVPNGPAVCIVSNELWQMRFGGRSDLIGQTIMLNSQSWQVVGIMPPSLTAPFNQVQVFAPRVFEVTGLTPQQVEAGAGYAQPIARLKRGVSLAQARAELEQIAKNYGARFGGQLDARNLSEPKMFVDSLVGNLVPTFNTLLGAVGFVLLVACANASSLLLSRLSARYKEIAIRQSLGATRYRVMRQFLVESLLFAIVAAVLGLVLASFALAAIQSIVSSQLPPGAVLTLNWRVLAFTSGVALVSSLLVGFLPALFASKPQLIDALKDSARGSSGEKAGRFRAALIVAEVALSVVLLVGSALLVISFMKLQHSSPGFDPAGVATTFIGVPPAKYSTPQQQAQFFNDILDRLQTEPRVTNAAAALALPLSGFSPQFPYAIGGRPVPPLSQRPLAILSIVSEGYFKLMRIPLIEGREFSAQDRSGAPGVCIISEALAKRLFPSESALGKVVMRGAKADVPAQIVGVARNVMTNGLNAPAPDEVYFPMRQLPRPGLAILARTTTDPAAMQGTIREAVASVDKDQPISAFATMQSTVNLSLGVQQIVSSLTAIFAGLALLLSAVGLYSVVADVVFQRTPEIGIRMALGAQPSHVVRLVMRGGLVLVGIGLAIGLTAAAGAARLIQSLLYEVRPLDPLVYGGVTVLFTTVAMLACLIPSLRAAKIDPLHAIRSSTTGPARHR